MSKQNNRIVMGQRLKAFRESRGLSAYRVAKKGGIKIGQVKAVEEGTTNYTIDIFQGYVIGCGLYMYFAEKENESQQHDFEELIKT